MIQLSTPSCSCIAILWVSLVSFADITICIGSQRVFIVVSIYFIIDAVRKLLVTPSYMLFFSFSLRATYPVHLILFDLMPKKYQVNSVRDLLILIKSKCIYPCQLIDIISYLN